MNKTKKQKRELLFKKNVLFVDIAISTIRILCLNFYSSCESVISSLVGFNNALDVIFVFLNIKYRFILYHISKEKGRC